VKISIVVEFWRFPDGPVPSPAGWPDARLVSYKTRCSQVKLTGVFPGYFLGENAWNVSDMAVAITVVPSLPISANVMLSLSLFSKLAVVQYACSKICVLTQHGGQ
jgi:hypothetical protein